jgi:hypothetical protein
MHGKPIKMSYILFFHSHRVQQNPEEFVGVLLRKIQILIILLAQRAKERPGNELAEIPQLMNEP